MKNKIIMVLLAVAVFIPSIVAIVSYNQTKNAPVSQKNIKELEIADLAGNTFSFSRGDTVDEDMIDFFLTMNESSDKISSLPAPLVGTSFFKVTMSSAQQSAEYQYYFSTDTAQAYYQDDLGTVYRIPEAYAEQFVASRYAVSLYVNAVIPSLSTGSDTDVVPLSATWMYKNSAGTYVACDAPITSAPQSISMEGGVFLGFTLEPDHFNVKLTDTATGNVLFNDQYKNIASLVLDRSMNLAVEIDAKWYEDSARDYYGEMKYSFNADIAAAAVFALGHETIENGWFTTVSATNIADVSRVQFSSSPDIGYTPVFYPAGDKAIALIPFRCDLPAGTYTLSFKYGGVTQDLTLEVTQKTVKLFQYDIDPSIVNATRTEKTIADFAAATGEIARTGDAAQYFEGTFVAPVKQTNAWNGVLTTGFGHNRRIGKTGPTYLHEGVDYAATKGSDVYAANKGKVVYTGYTELGGNTVVIEHGYGLKTWYCHLSEIKVAVGDIVEREAVIGGTGSTGFINQNGVHTSLTVFDVPVSPYPLWDDPIPLP